MKNISNNKKNKNMKKNGFTLVELLAVIAVLSVVLTVVVYSVIEVVSNSKKKSYQATINNIQTTASNYLLEEISSNEWINGLSSDYQYQCVTVQNLIDAGHFKSDVLESLVDDDIYVSANDFIYVERDSNSKSIVKNILLVGKASSYKGLCSGISAYGNISFDVNPVGWSTTKDVIIKYRLYNYDIVSSYKYNYSYVLIDNSLDKTLNNSFVNSLKEETVTVDKNGRMIAKILDKDSNEVASRVLSVSNIDNDKPVASINSTNDVASAQTVTLNMSDSGSGIKAYYFGKVNPDEMDVEWIIAESGMATNEGGILSSYSDTYKVDSDGVWYLGVVDVVGNMTVVSKSFYKTSLSITNASISLDTILTMEGNEFLVPEVSANVGYVFNGWYPSNSYNGSVMSKYKPTSNSTLYGKVSMRTYGVTLDNNGATTSGTKEIYEWYGVGVYLDDDYTKKMTASVNPISLPKKTGYAFNGYYLSSATSDDGILMINSSGYITSNFTNKIFSENTTLVAKWVSNYIITLDNNNATSAGTSQIYGKYGVGVYLDAEYTKGMTISVNKITIPKRTGHVFKGYYSGSTQMINSSGYITTNLNSTTFISDTTLKAKWVDNTPPSCVLKLTTSGVEFESVDDNVGVVLQRLSTEAPTNETVVASMIAYEIIPIATGGWSGPATGGSSGGAATSGSSGAATGESSGGGTSDSTIIEGKVYGYVEDAAGNVGTCSIDIESSLNYSTVKCSKDNYKDREGACTDNYSSDNCKATNTYKYNATKCQCWYDEADRKYRWREANWLSESGIDSCKATVSDYSQCSYSQEGTNQICGCSSYVTGTTYKGEITCYTDSCSEGYTKLESSNYCYKLG